MYEERSSLEGSYADVGSVVRCPRIGVVGTGWWATQHHIPSLLAHPDCALVALADSDPDRLSAAGRHFGVARTFDTADGLLDSGEVDGVVIAVPHRHHYSVTRAALRRGIHVLVEKPLTLQPAEAWELVRLAADRDLHLLVGYTYQYTWSARRCREAVQGGEIGELVQVCGQYMSATEAYYRGDVAAYRDTLGYAVTGPRPDTYSDPELAGGGQAQTQLSHPASMLLWVTGQRPDRVCAFLDNRGLAVDTVDAVSFRLAGGALGTLASAGSLPAGHPGRRELSYFGTGGHAVQDLDTGRVEIHRAGRDRTVVPPAAGDRQPAGLPARTFAALIAGHGTNPAPADVGAYAVEFVAATYRAAALGRPVPVAELYQSEQPDPTDLP